MFLEQNCFPSSGAQATVENFDLDSDKKKPGTAIVG